LIDRLPEESRQYEERLKDAEQGCKGLKIKGLCGKVRRYNDLREFWASFGVVAMV
jgi:hypothetical protein